MELADRRRRRTGGRHAVLGEGQLDRPGIVGVTHAVDEALALEWTDELRHEQRVETSLVGHGSLVRPPLSGAHPDQRREHDVLGVRDAEGFEHAVGGDSPPCRRQPDERSGLGTGRHRQLYMAIIAMATE